MLMKSAQRQRGAGYDAGCDEHLRRGFVHRPPLFHRARSSDTTFYVVALYFGSVGIRNTYYTIPCSLLADLAGAVAAVTMTYLFFT